MDCIWCPNLDASIMAAITQCGQCKNFGGTHLHALLEPITRRHPFELLVGDYLSMPNGKGRYHTIGLYLDTYSQHVWAFKHKSAGTVKTTVDVLSRIFQDFVAAETFMSDGGRHFDNNEVRAICHKWGTTTHIVPAYSPWINGLVEGTTKSCYTYSNACVRPTSVKTSARLWLWKTSPKRGQNTWRKQYG